MTSRAAVKDTLHLPHRDMEYRQPLSVVCERGKYYLHVASEQLAWLLLLLVSATMAV